MRSFVCVLFAVLALSQATEVEKKKKRKSAAWPESAWKIDKSTGNIAVHLKATKSASQAPNEWYTATNSAPHGLKSFANLNNENGETYLVGSKQLKSGPALPSREEEVVLFKVDGTPHVSGEDVRMTLKPVSPPTGAHSLERKKKMFVDPITAGFLWAPYYYAWGFAWTWAAAATVATDAPADLEAAPKKHPLLNKMLHSLEADMKELAVIEHVKGKDMEKKMVFASPQVSLGSIGGVEALAGCASYVFFAYFAAGCGTYLVPASQ